MTNGASTNGEDGGDPRLVPFHSRGRVKMREEKGRGRDKSA